MIYILSYTLAINTDLVNYTIISTSFKTTAKALRISEKVEYRRNRSEEHQVGMAV